MSSQLEDIPTVKMKITGKVQGVGFRYFVMRQAQKLSIKGWVSNNSNGNVEALAQGEKEGLDHFIVKVKQGPTFSSVEDVSLNWRNKAEQYSGFEII